MFAETIMDSESDQNLADNCYKLLRALHQLRNPKKKKKKIARKHTNANTAIRELSLKDRTRKISPMIRSVSTRNVMPNSAHDNSRRIESRLVCDTIMA